MGFRESYEANKKRLLNDKKINADNRQIFSEFFNFQEEKLKRINDNAELDEPSYKTLVGYINRFINVNKWFKNKSWKNLTAKDIKKVYDDLEEGRIVNRFGKRYGDRRSYYTKVFKSKPFELAGKNKEVSEALGLFTDRRRREVKFVNAENFNKIISVVKNPYHLCLLWLSWDIGENINTLLRLTASNFKKQINKDTKETEYLVWLPQSQLKRSRQQRSELTLFKETAQYLDIILEGLKPNEQIFKFEYRQALKFFDSAVKRSGAICEPDPDKPSWKDLRTGMAMNLFLNYGWHSDDINLRLGHNITSKELESYFSYGAGKSKKVKKLHYNNNLEQIKEEFEELKQIEKGKSRRIEEQGEQIEEQKSKIKRLVDLNEIFLEKELGKLTQKQFKEKLSHYLSEKRGEKVKIVDE